MKANVKETASDFEQEINALLATIPPQLEYQEWFRVAAALKNCGAEFTVFDNWSQRAPEKYSREETERVWSNAGGEGKPEVGIGTLVWLSKKYETAPGEILAEPQEELELAGQTLIFLSSNFNPGECFEVVTQTRDINGRTIPCRSKENLFSCTDSENMTKLFRALADCKSGAWVSMNPIKSEITGNAPCDTDVTEYRCTLIEADTLTKEEQWAELSKLHLPIQSVVWSGGKSLHALVLIEAGTDRKLYDERVKALHEYLDRHNFPYDKANKNPSRLTRLPGVCRGDDIQYLAAGKSGPASWKEFEAVYLAAPRHDRRSETSPLNGLRGGRGKTPVTDLAVTFLNEHRSETGLPILHCFMQRWYLFKPDGWHEVTTDDIEMKITGWLQQEGVHRMERIGKALVGDVLKNLESDKLCGLPASDYRMPCWLPGGEDASHWMVFRNGALNLKALIEKPDSAPEFKPISPALFVKGCVDYDYEPRATCPMWEYYLDTTFDSEEMRQAFQMHFGYILSGETRLNVGFFWIGQGGDGKSTAAHILRKLVGEYNTCCLPFGNLKDKFSTFQLTETKLNLVEELPVTSEQGNITECEKVFKLVTDGGELNIERKYQQPTKAPATARIVYAANALPQFVDRTKGLWDRLVILPFNHRFRGTSEERSDFKRELEKELPGICNWAIRGAQMLVPFTRFPVPEAAKQMIEQHHAICDHETEFFKEWVVEEPDVKISKQALYTAYANEMKDSGYRPKGKSNFNAALKVAFPDIKEGRYRDRRQDIQIWQGITLKAGANTYRTTY